MEYEDYNGQSEGTEGHEVQEEVEVVVELEQIKENENLSWG